MSPVDVRIEPPRRTDATFVRPANNERSDRASALTVMVLSLACTALSVFDLLLLASGH